MKRLLVLTVSAFSAACSQTATSAAANIIGAHDLVQAGRYMFITSRDTNELRVMDLEPPNLPAGSAMYVTAPNPLQSLSIPVLDRPTDVVVDEHYDEAGVLKAGSYVFAMRRGGAELSVVGATAEEFREEKRLLTAAPVTAFSGWFDAVDNLSRVYFATWDGTQANLYVASMPPTAAALRGQGVRIDFLTTTGSSPVAALKVLPPLSSRTSAGAPFCAAGQECLAIATRRGSGTEGDSFLLDPRTKGVAKLAFPGPVRMLATHGCGYNPDVGCDIQPGQRLFGVLDEEVCGNPTCGGVIAVDTRTADATGGFPIANDVTGAPMVPIQVGQGLVAGLTLGPGVVLTMPASWPDPNTHQAVGQIVATSFQVVGFATTTTGELLFFNAGDLQQFELDATPPSVTDSYMYDPTGTLTTSLAGPVLANDDGSSAVGLADGAWRTQQVFATWNGVVTGAAALPHDPTHGVHLTIPANLLSRVLTGDTATFFQAGVACGTGTVTRLFDDGVDVDQLPAGCTPMAFTVRAGPTLPIAVQGGIAGYMGRVGPGGTLSYHGDYYMHPPGYDATAPTLTLSFGTDANASTMTAGSYWALDIAGGFAPFVSVIDTTTVTTCNPNLPGSAVLDITHGRIFIAVPSANGVLELNPALSGRGALGTTAGVICYR